MVIISVLKGNTMDIDAHAPCESLLFDRESHEMIRYPKTREVIHHDGSKPPKLGTYTPPLPYLVVKHN